MLDWEWKLTKPKIHLNPAPNKVQPTFPVSLESVQIPLSNKPAIQWKYLNNKLSLSHNQSQT